ncbi:MAG: ABC transporter permease [PVC group bacterium]|nr:ABC transporter permease [PVC group bacterium]
MKYEFWIGIRYLFGRSKEKFISIITLISVVGVATGVAALIIVIGVMSGFDNELRDRIIGTSSHLVINKIGGIDDADHVKESVSKIKHVTAVAPFVNTQALLIDDARQFPVVIRGVDQELESQVTGIKKFVTIGKLDLAQNNIIIGRELANRLLLKVGDEVVLIGLGSVAEESFKISGIFTSGMYDYDSGVVFISLFKAKELSETPNLVSGISVKLDDVYRAKKVKKAIQDELGFPYFTRTWMDLNRNLFNALKLEKTAMFVILTLIVLVASLNIASTLIMMVMEKTKDVGILKAIGASGNSIRTIFTAVGITIGMIGTILGTAGGLGMAYILKTYKFIKLPKDVYYIDTLPVRIEYLDIFWIIAAALCISLIATFYPAYQAARLNPVEALRYE